jgi:hypothetical protein
VSLVALALTGLFFAVTPRMEAGLLGRSDTAVFRTQLSDAINLSQGGYISLDQTPVMRVRFPDEPSGQYNGNLFWRASTLCQYGAGNWERNGITPLPDQPAFALSAKAAAIPALFGGGMAIRRAPHENRRVVRHIAYINDVPAEGIPLLTLVKDVRIDGASGGSALMWDPNADFTVIFKKRGAPWLEYEAVSEVEDFTPDQLRTAPDNYGEVLPFRDYRVLTYHHLSTETLRTVERVTNGKATVYDKVSALLRYLAGNQFLYSRNLPQLPSEDPIDAFLNATRLGHCELFASALALMLRSQGIPTRVVSGYRGGEWSGRDQSYVVRADMAHMWVEVFFIGIGWVTFDPSPADIQAYSTLNSIYRWVTRYTLYAKMLWYRDIVSYNRGFQIQALRNLRLGVIRYGAGLWQMRTVVRRSSATPAVAGILVAGGAAAMILVLWLTRRRRSQVLGVWLTTDQQNAIRLYRKLRRALRKKGCPCDGKTAEEIQHETAEMPWAHAVAALVEGYNRVRFGQTPLTPAEQAQWRQLLKVISSRN